MQKESKFIWLIPVLSLLLVNLHASMWPCLFILMLPYLAEFSYNYLKKKDKKIFKLFKDHIKLLHFKQKEAVALNN